MHLAEKSRKTLTANLFTANHKYFQDFELMKQKKNKMTKTYCFVNSYFMQASRKRAVDNVPQVFAPRKKIVSKEVLQLAPQIAPWWTDRIVQLGRYFPAPRIENLEVTPFSQEELSRLSQWHQATKWVPKQTQNEQERALQRAQLKFKWLEIPFANELQMKLSRTIHVAKRSKAPVRTDALQRTWKIRVRPTPEQKKFLHARFAIVNQVYNETLRKLCQGLVSEEDAKSTRELLQLPIEDPRRHLRKNVQRALQKMGKLKIVAKESLPTLLALKQQVISGTSLPCWEKIIPLILTPAANPELAKSQPRIFDSEQCNYDSRAEAVHEAVVALGSTRVALNTMRANESNKPNTNSEDIKTHYDKIKILLKRRTRHDPKQHIHIKTSGGAKAELGQEKIKPKTVKWNDDGFEFWKQSEFGVLSPYRLKEFNRMRMKLGSEGCDQRATLKYERPGRYYLCLPYFKPLQIVDLPKEYKDQRAIVAMDCGGKTFQATFDDQGRFHEYGKGAAKQLYDWQQKIVSLREEILVKKARSKRRSLHKQVRRIALKIQDLRRDMHQKLATHLVRRYTDVMLPRLQVKKMIKLPRIPKEQLQILRHAQFSRRLMQQAELHGTRVHTVPEYFTSQTCGSCGLLYSDIGASRLHVCQRCGTKFDRDLNAARLIFLSNVERHCGAVAVRAPELYD